MLLTRESLRIEIALFAQSLHKGVRGGPPFDPIIVLPHVIDRFESNPQRVVAATIVASRRAVTISGISVRSGPAKCNDSADIFVAEGA